MHASRLHIPIGWLVAFLAFNGIVHGAAAGSSAEPVRASIERRVSLREAAASASQVSKSGVSEPATPADSGTVAGGIPANDDCANATPITNEGTFGFNNLFGTLDGPSHLACSSSDEPQIDHDIWYCWTAPAQECTGSFVVDTCGLTGVDTKIAVYDGCSCPPTVDRLLACRDDDCGSQTRATFTAAPGQQFLIRVGNFPGLPGGDGDFAITCEESPPCTEPVTHCQAADQAGARTSNRTSFRAAEGFTPTIDGNLSSVCWWGTYSVSSGDSTDCQGNSPDAFEVRYLTDADGIPGTEIASFSQMGGTLTVDAVVATGNLINDVAAEYEFHATHADVPVQAGQCVWIEITNALTGCVWYWETGDVGDRRAMQDGSSMVPPNGYDSLDGIVADLAFCTNLQIEPGGTACYPPTPANDDCANAETLSGVGSFAVVNVSATTDGPSHLSCESSGASGIGRDVWFQWNSICDGQVLLRTCELSDVDTKIAVYNGTTCPTSQTEPLVCNDDICVFQSMVVFNATLGQDYLIRMGAYPGSPGGVVQFEIICGAPDNAFCPGTGSCCGAAGGRGCDDELCCETVCACDPFCCETEWDSGCGDHGFGNPPSGCGAAELCECVPICGQPEAGDCCTGHSTPGCDDAACCEAVCACDPFCCETEWDFNCAGKGLVPDCGAEVLCTTLCTTGPVCPTGVFTFVNPPKDIVDARQPHAPGDPAALQGYKTFIVTGPHGADPECWALCETAVAGTPNSIASVVEGPNSTYTITLNRPITPAAVTSLTYAPTTGAETTGFFTAHPANVNGDSASAPVDILELIDHLNGVRVPALNLWQCDIDRSSLCAPADILSEIDLLNGASGFAIWNGTARPSASGLCPRP